MPKIFINRFQTIDELIQKKETGNAVALAEKLRVSERTVKEFISVMKALGAPIYFNRKAGSYCYLKPGKFVIRFDTL
jgi:predicted DNA-binding transcriptional regulator YafY